eukprot:CAMPEP_0196764392 /NCGR_PEP_ID=MMETSP1095-20130614/6021_1 /TAXON_ID=96789 ORGANISM="Chromulina nebulosa, Strain UTEXLB2642" /NCGR_SAMPLE_ID=MMETSP1095 /ASSEMBLY_ACC=CAM_ASM_000446 /LENGTH=74 /DNA_ID=CAMNT_0042119839 /DNA_START=459 /DNA_END=683 /DNA_ORIENTATION=-
MTAPPPRGDSPNPEDGSLRSIDSGAGSDQIQSDATCFTQSSSSSYGGIIPITPGKASIDSSSFWYPSTGLGIPP